MHDNTNYDGSDIVNALGAPVTGTSMECGAKCVATPTCEYWTWFNENYPTAKDRGRCLLKTAKGNEQTVPWGISGSKTCPLQSGT